MRSFRFHPYQLNPIYQTQSHFVQRQGALIQVTFPDGICGYADCHPWPELGDLPLRVQLEKAFKAEFTPLFDQTLRLARIDGEARFEKGSLWEGAAIPRSHFLISSLAPFRNCFDQVELKLRNASRAGIRRVKCKIGKHLSEDLELVENLVFLCRQLKMKLRLDLNGSLRFSEMDSFFDAILPYADCMDWVEDPAPFEPNLWRRVQEKWGIRLALDRIDPALPVFSKVLAEPSSFRVWDGAFSVMVLKPAVQNLDGSPFLELVQRLVERSRISLSVTSYLDHPVGQVGAAWVASRLKKNFGAAIEDCGLLSHSVYESNPFSECLRVEDGILVPTKGTGFGWDGLFEELRFETLGCG